MIQSELIAMKFHETLAFNGFSVMRVYKGWIYTFYKKNHCEGVGDQIVMTSVFVPK